MFGAIVETEALLKVIGASFAGVVGVTIAFSFAIVGAHGFTDSRRDGRMGAASAYGLVTLVALAVCVGAVVFGIIVMTTKD